MRLIDVENAPEVALWSVTVNAQVAQPGAETGQPLNTDLPVKITKRRIKSTRRVKRKRDTPAAVVPVTVKRRN